MSQKKRHDVTQKVSILWAEYEVTVLKKESLSAYL